MQIEKAYLFGRQMTGVGNINPEFFQNGVFTDSNTPSGFDLEENRFDPVFGYSESDYSLLDLLYENYPNYLGTSTTFLSSTAPYYSSYENVARCYIENGIINMDYNHKIDMESGGEYVEYSEELLIPVVNLFAGYRRLNIKYKASSVNITYNTWLSFSIITRDNDTVEGYSTVGAEDGDYDTNDWVTLAIDIEELAKFGEISYISIRFHISGIYISEREISFEVQIKEISAE